MTVQSKIVELPSDELAKAFVGIICQGNKKYDTVFVDEGQPFLSTYDVVQRCVSLGLSIPKYGEIGFLELNRGEEEVAAFFGKQKPTVRCHSYKQGAVCCVDFCREFSRPF